MPAKGTKKRYCKHGHDKTIVGTKSNGWCLACATPRINAANRRRREEGIHRQVKFRSPICPKGHDKRIVGVSCEGQCMTCRREQIKDYSLNLRRRWAGFPGEPGPIPNLQRIRISAGLTAKEMALRVGISKKYYERLEKGGSASRKTLARVVRAVSELRASALEGHNGKFGRLLKAMAEAERRKDPTATRIAEIGMFSNPSEVGSLLRWARERGLAQRHETKYAVHWSLTPKARRQVGVSFHEAA